MAEEEAVPETATEKNNSSSEDMELETLVAPAPNPKEDNDNESEPNGVDSAGNGESNLKRLRVEGTESEEEEKGDGAKKQKVEKSVEEERLEKLEDSGVVEGEGGEEKESDRVSVGPKNFGSSAEMFDYFYKFLHYWPPNLNVNEYEHMVLLDLLKKGHAEPDKKIGGGIHAFQVRYHPMWKSRCYFLLRDDESVDDFSFRKCVDHILPLPENMKVKSDVNKALGGGGGGRGGGGGGGGGGGRGGRGGGGRGGGRGRGRGGKWRH